MGRAGSAIRGGGSDLVGRGRTVVGNLEFAGVRARRAARRDRQGHARTRLRDRVRLRLARPARRPAGRTGPHARATRVGGRLSTTVRVGFSARQGHRRGRPVSGRILRPGDLRVRRQHLERSVPMDSRSGARPAAWRRPDIPSQRHAAHVVLRRLCRRAGRHQAAAAVLRDASVRVARRRQRGVSHSPRRVDPAPALQRFRGR